MAKRVGHFAYAVVEICRIAHSIHRRPMAHGISVMRGPDCLPPRIAALQSETKTP
jgi:hypothetical protein